MADATKVDFANGDAVIATDGDWEVRGVVSEVYDDVVEVDYLDEFGTIDTMEFHVSCVQSVIYSKTYNYLDTVGEVTNLASGGGTELPLSEMSTYFSTLL